MHLTFDPPKDAANLAKHGVSLTQAAQLEWDSAVVWTDARRAYGEPRQCGIRYALRGGNCPVGLPPAGALPCCKLLA